MDRPLTAGLLATDLEAFTNQAWPLLERYALCEGPMSWACLCEYLTAVTERQIRRLLITILPANPPARSAPH